MTALVLIPWAQTDWSTQGRMASHTSLSLNEQGRQRAGAWGEAMAALNLQTVYCSEEQTSLETAQIVANCSGARRKSVEDLAEVGVGLWEGLTVAELRRRYPKTFKCWEEDRSSVRPPEGEEVAAAAVRIRARIDRIAKDAAGKAAGVVLGPMALGLARCALESAKVSKMNSLMFDAPLCYSLTEDDRSAELMEELQVPGAVRA